MRFLLVGVSALITRPARELLITDVTNVTTTTAPSDGTDYKFVGAGYCANTRQERIITAEQHPSTWMNDDFRSTTCEKLCDMRSQCAGYNSLAQTCELVRANDRYYGGGIDDSTGYPEVYCFRKASAPVAPFHVSCWETWGKVSLAIMVSLIAFFIAYGLITGYYASSAAKLVM
eukprot:GEMP01013650.1.p1 GENE.GEMP01013650.1~~GEMP01013650.1.p1  ORF type:complete len:174 (+),score=29.36 GEMP01013650.1:162-683(+)